MAHSPTSAIPKYLERYAETEIHQLPALLRERSFDYALAIPAYRESPDFVHRLANTLFTQHACLLIVIINQPDHLSFSDTSDSADSSNTALWQHLLKLVEPDKQHYNQNRDQVFVELGFSETETKIKTESNKSSALLMVDRFTRGRAIPLQQGVGLARKIAADIALSLIATKTVKQPWIWNSDADAYLPEDYFSVIPLNKKPTQLNNAAYIYPFRHTVINDTEENTKISSATRLYEQSLNYYVAGLRWAGSPYAFHTLGSTVAVNGEHYAQVRGFPKRAGAEDFYLLNKLVKTGVIETLDSAEIEIESRPSNRVPFGTGPAVEKLLALPELSEAQLFYHPEIFKQLKTWLTALPKLFNCSLEELEIEKSTHSTLLEMNVDAAIAHAKAHSHSEAGFCRQMNTWFDGFRTLKFIHLLRDTSYGSISLDSAKNVDFFSPDIR